MPLSFAIGCVQCVDLPARQTFMLDLTGQAELRWGSSLGARSHEHCLRSLGVNALNPELHVAMLARDPADPRIESPAPEQPR